MHARISLVTSVYHEQTNSVWHTALKVIHVVQESQYQQMRHLY